MARNRKWTHEAFEAYVRRLEPEASRDPAGYRSKVIGWIALGYGYIGLLLLGTLALVGILALGIYYGRGDAALIKFGIVLLAFAGALLRSLWVRLPAPEGIALSRDDAPDLFALVEGLRRRMGAPVFSRILLTREFNAAAAQTPRLGVFGWPQNDLIVGMPLMMALSPEQFASVLAHELGHLRGDHGSFGSRVWRIQATWARLAESGVGLLRAFADWYFPRISAYTFPLRRQNEYEADRSAADAVGARVAADALCLLPVRGEQLSVGFWSPLGKSLFTVGEAPRQVYTQIEQLLRQEPLEGDAVQRALRDALLADTTYADSHPALKDRLRALGQEPRVPERPQESAAERYFGPRRERLVGLLDREWHRENAEGWRQRHAELSKARGAFEALDVRYQAGEALTDEERYEHAAGVRTLRGKDEALPLYRALFDSADLGAQARFDAGRILIERDDPEGATLLEEALARRPALAGDGLPLLHAYHKRRGDEERARTLYTEGLRHADRELAAAAERSTITQKDVFLAHACTEEQVRSLRQALADVPELGEAYLIRKKLEHFAEEGDFLILVITLKKRRLRTDGDADMKKLFQVVDARVPMAVIPIHGPFLWMRNRVNALPEARILPESV